MSIWIRRLSALAIALLMFIAAVGKALDIGLFMIVLRTHGVPLITARILSYWIPALEAVIALSFCFRWPRPAATLLSAVLLTAFALVQFGNALFGVAGDCGCFGALLPEIDVWAAAFRTAGLATIATALTIHELRKI